MVRRRALSSAFALLAAPCSPAAAKDDEPGTVNVLCAGSLLNLMEHGVGAAFDKETGGTFRGYAGGSNKLANEIKGRLRHGDVFVSANPHVNDDLSGAANRNWVDWYVTSAQSPLVTGYNPTSRSPPTSNKSADMRFCRSPASG